MTTLRGHLRGFSIVPAALVALAALSCAPGERTANQPGMAGEQAIAEPAGVEAAFDAFVTAWEEEDREALNETFTDDAVAFDPVPPGKFEGAAGIDGLLSATFQQLDDIDITISEPSVHTEGRVGWLTARYVFAGQPVAEGAEPTRDEGYVSTVWVLQPDGSYRIPLFHASVLPEAPEGPGQ